MILGFTLRLVINIVNMKKIIIIIFAYLVSFDSHAQFAFKDGFMTNKKVTNFSNSSKKDTFMVRCIWKDTIKNGKVRFYITNSDSKILFDTTFSSLSKILGYDNDPETKFKLEIKSKYKNYLKHRLDIPSIYKIMIFFESSKFSSPAIEKDVNYDKELSSFDKQTFLEIQKDQTSVSYAISVLDEISLSLVYLKKTKRVIVY